MKTILLVLLTISFRVSAQPPVVPSPGVLTAIDPAEILRTHVWAQGGTVSIIAGDLHGPFIAEVFSISGALLHRSTPLVADRHTIVLDDRATGVVIVRLVGLREERVYKVAVGI